MKKITNFLRGIENKTHAKDSTHYFPRGSWHSKDTLEVDVINGDAGDKIPAKLLEQYLPDGGTILEIYAGACDITYHIAKLGMNPKWKIYATDIQATDFLTTPRSEKWGIELYDISINDLIKQDLPEKIDVLLCRHAFGRIESHFGGGTQGQLTDEERDSITKNNTMTEEWMFRNFRYYLADIGVRGERSVERYEQNLNMYSDGINNVDILGGIEEFYLVKLNEID